MSEYLKKTRVQAAVTANDTTFQDAKSTTSPIVLVQNTSQMLVIPKNALEFFLRPEEDIDVQFEGETGVYRVTAGEHIVFQTGTKSHVTLIEPDLNDDVSVWFGFNLGGIY